MENRDKNSLSGLRIGFGYDNHSLEEASESLARTGFVIGGIKIASPKSIVAYSDGDVLFHALIDSLLGASALGDIGTHFPDNEPKYKNADSKNLLKETLLKINAYQILNLDATIILEKPKLAPYINKIKTNLSQIIKNITNQYVSINLKAKTNERQDSLGQGNSIACYVVSLLLKR